MQQWLFVCKAWCAVDSEAAGRCSNTRLLVKRNTIPHVATPAMCPLPHTPHAPRPRVSPSAHRSACVMRVTLAWLMYCLAPASQRYRRADSTLGYSPCSGYAAAH